MGSSPSWYFSRLQVQDLQTGDKYFFICEQWLSVDDEDGMVGYRQHCLIFQRLTVTF